MNKSINIFEYESLAPKHLFPKELLSLIMSVDSLDKATATIDSLLEVVTAV